MAVWGSRPHRDWVSIPRAPPGSLARVQLILDFRLWHPQSWMLSNSRSTRRFLGPPGINSSREAEVRFLTDSKLKTDNRETARTHSTFLGETERTLCFIRVQRKRFLDQQQAPAPLVGRRRGCSVCLLECVHTHALRLGPLAVFPGTWEAGM